MAQNVTIAGASYSGVPSIEVPKTGGGAAGFFDVSDTTATASDVAAGKTFHLGDGSPAVGTKQDQGISVVTTQDSHGGDIVEITATVVSGASPIPVVMRPDAELVQRWSGDEKIVEDLELALPAYSTSAKTIKTGAALSPVIAMDLDYRYYVAYFCMAEPIYSTETKVKGRCEYDVSAFLYEIALIPANTFQTLDGSKAYATRQIVAQANGSIGRELYWTSATAVGVANNTTYGAYCTGQAPTISGTNLTVKAPIYGIRGNATYMASGAWSSMTDIREQWIAEVWRAPAEACEGWGLATAMLDILDDVNDGGTLRR